MLGWRGLHWPLTSSWKRRLQVAPSVLVLSPPKAVGFGGIPRHLASLDREYSLTGSGGNFRASDDSMPRCKAWTRLGTDQLRRFIAGCLERCAALDVALTEPPVIPQVRSHRNDCTCLQGCGRINASASSMPTAVDSPSTPDTHPPPHPPQLLRGAHAPTPSTPHTHPPPSIIWPVASHGN